MHLVVHPPRPADAAAYIKKALRQGSLPASTWARMPSVIGLFILCSDVFSMKIPLSVCNFTFFGRSHQSQLTAFLYLRPFVFPYCIYFLKLYQLSHQFTCSRFFNSKNSAISAILYSLSGSIHSVIFSNCCLVLFVYFFCISAFYQRLLISAFYQHLFIRTFYNDNFKMVLSGPYSSATSGCFHPCCSHTL